MDNQGTTPSTYAEAARLATASPPMEIGVFGREDLGIPGVQSTERTLDWVQKINLLVGDEDMRQRETDITQDEPEDCQDLENSCSVSSLENENVKSQLFRHLRSARLQQEFQCWSEDPNDRAMKWLMRLPLVPMSSESHIDHETFQEIPITEEELQMDLELEQQLADAFIASEREQLIPPTSQILSAEDATDSEEESN